MNKCYAQEEIWSVLDMVLLKEKIEGLDKRLDTNIGEKGIKLSAGEKQKLAYCTCFITGCFNNYFG